MFIYERHGDLPAKTLSFGVRYSTPESKYVSPKTTSKLTGTVASKSHESTEIRDNKALNVVKITVWLRYMPNEIFEPNDTAFTTHFGKRLLSRASA